MQYFQWWTFMPQTNKYNNDKAMKRINNFLDLLMFYAQLSKWVFQTNFCFEQIIANFKEKNMVEHMNFKQSIWIFRFYVFECVQEFCHSTIVHVHILFFCFLFTVCYLCFMFLCKCARSFIYAKPSKTAPFN